MHFYELLLRIFFYDFLLEEKGGAKDQDSGSLSHITRRTLALENVPCDRFLKLPDENMLNWKEILSFSLL